MKMTTQARVGQIINNISRNDVQCLEAGMYRCPVFRGRNYRCPEFRGRNDVQCLEAGMYRCPEFRGRNV